MSDVTCPFAPSTRGLDEPDPVRPALRRSGPLVEAQAPAGGPVWIVTDAELARAVFADPRISKDPALAPPSWDPRVAGLEPPAAQQPALTTLEGEAHAALRRAHAPLLAARRMLAGYDQMMAIARELLGALGDGPVDLTEDFSTRYPLTVVCDVLGVPRDRVDDAIAACRGMYSDDPALVGAAMGAFADLAAAAVRSGDGIAAELAGRMPSGTTGDDLHYQLFALLFAGQLTTDPAVGFLVARALAEPGEPEELVRETLREHPPAPFSLWRFTATEIELAGTRLPAGAPLLVDIEGINGHITPGEQDLSFGGGHHYCAGAQLARYELQALVEVLRTDHPDARLAVSRSELRAVSPAGIGGSRLAALPVILR
ncbi:cytochrome P450 [Pseudonocardia sediminis]|uniref:Cytochrome P450 n=1 Tax=Pseudonocardia sediminis TaxID=1397368 RepID=A0A4Q7USY0_PSEST|nr:cytochrome P450 [Pseudonocardia sediminis]RZT84825.1 cytochrome P450 [Pseudonocardia sediminis]